MNKTIKKIVKFLADQFFFYVPLFFLIQIAFSFVEQIGKTTSSDGQYKILFAGVGLMATFSGLSFALYPCAKDESRKFDYYLCGKKFFHSALLFSMAIALQYGVEIGNFSYGSMMTNLCLFICKFFVTFFLFIAILLSQQALLIINKDFFNSWINGECQIERNGSFNRPA